MYRLRRGVRSLEGLVFRQRIDGSCPENRSDRRDSFSKLELWRSYPRLLRDLGS